MKSLIARLQQQEKTDVLLRANPILAGFLQLDNHFQFLQTGCNAVLITWRFRAFCHMYAALKDRGLLESIPFFEDLLSIYERAIFTPSRAAVTYGSFLRTYLLSVDISAATVDAFFRDMKMPPPEKTRKVRDRYHIHDLSRVFSILVESNLSVLQRGSSSMPKTLKGLLGGVADISRQELFESRVLSRDTLKLSDDLADLFKSLCAVLGHREVLNKYLAPGNCPKSRLEESVMLGLMPLLDCLELDGSVRDTEEKVLQEATNLSYDRHGGAVAEYCRQAANTIARRFIKSEETSPWMETAYFVFPDTPNWISLAFSDVPFGSNAERKTRFANFNTLMAMLERSTGPLFAEQTKTLKELIKADPGLLELSHGSSSGLYPPVPNSTRLSDLPMLLHQAAAGPARDKRLVEWMVQMGALHLQPTHCRSPKPPKPLPGNKQTDLLLEISSHVQIFICGAFESMNWGKDHNRSIVHEMCMD
ncbi:hypothetical protein Poli38472_003361 [Pythium oligandrum]|uniref:Uncharacterized protein n=1 Tax=Pythium oligandrum TaxID=41045 RepID=A0A8K1FCP9_PYTOL|nr:hypothetical protein Poli38472_003361 [Pythium oligandrum]|eukprot:TMW57436.1 hypothetical protein Poli38472_003361 [Pythium oligandrum]